MAPRKPSSQSWEGEAPAEPDWTWARREPRPPGPHLRLWGRSERSDRGSRGTESRHRTAGGARRCRQGTPVGFAAAGGPSGGRPRSAWSWNSAGLRADRSLSRVRGRNSHHPAWLEQPGRSGIREARRAGGRTWPDTAACGRSRPRHPTTRSASGIRGAFRSPGAEPCRPAARSDSAGPRPARVIRPRAMPRIWRSRRWI